MKETTYQEKIPLIQPWFDEVIESIKRDLKAEHLNKDRSFCQRHFMGAPVNQLPVKSLAIAYTKEIAEGNVGLAEFIATRWLLKNTDVYHFFEEALRKITTNFEELKEIEPELAKSLKEASIKKFGAKRTFLFSLFNSVVFSDEVYDELRRAALTEVTLEEEQEQIVAYDKMQERYERKIAALTDRYEKKLNGFQKKYIQDMEKLKKQIELLKQKSS